MLQLESVGDAQLEELQALLAAGAGVHVEMEERDHLLAQAKVRSGVGGGIVSGGRRRSGGRKSSPRATAAELAPYALGLEAQDDCAQSSARKVRAT